MLVSCEEWFTQNDGDWNTKISRVYSVSINFGESLRILCIQWGINLLIHKLALRASATRVVDTSCPHSPRPSVGEKLSLILDIYEITFLQHMYIIWLPMLNRLKFGYI